MDRTVSPRQLLLSLSLVTATIFAGLPTTGSAQTIFFTENFDSSDFASRGWYDIVGGGGTIDSTNHIPGSAASWNCHFTLGGTVASAGRPNRHKFTASDTVYISFWMKMGSASVTWQGSGRPYHPHMFFLLTDADGDFVGPNSSHLEVGIETSVFKPRMFVADGLEINTSFLGVNLLSSATRHAIAGGNGNQNASSGSYVESGAPTGYNNQTYWDAASSSFTNNTWHHVEVYIAMNSTSGSTAIANADGILKMWVDRNLVINFTNVYLRTGNNPTRKFNQLLLSPYIGDGSPIAQDLWIDDLIVADQPIPSQASVPAPANLRVIQ